MNSVYSNFKDRYMSHKDNLVSDFYKPAFFISKEYKRMSGYFSSNLFEVIASELAATNTFENIKIKIICSPELSNEDKLNIAKGYSIKNLIEEHIISDIEEIGETSLDFPFVSKLIIDEVIDFKFVVNKSGEGIFHSKEGIFIDYNNEKIAFSGSNNETLAAVNKNFEVTNVYYGEPFEKYIEEIEETFDEIWNNQNPMLTQISITDKIFTKLKEQIEKNLENNKNTSKTLSITDYLTLYPYQKKAIQLWEENNFHGLLEMATGTGKTITALASQEHLSKKVNNLLTVIVVPQIDLVNQWSEELENFGVRSINCSSASSNWKKIISPQMNALKKGKKNSLFILTTIETFKSTDFQKVLKRYNIENNLIIADEVHSFGARQAVKLYDELEQIFNYRLGISATPFRKSEEETDKLISFFDKIIYQYTLKDAIKNGYLNEYEYYPIILSFSASELEMYRNNLNDKFRNNLDGIALKEIEHLTASIANASSAKINKLTEVIKQHGVINPKIVYCSPGKYNDGRNIQNERHINVVKRTLGNIENCKLRVIVSDVETVERNEILKQFKGGLLNTLLAIKCLDQGVNIRNVTHAYILSSTDSLTEFIQRRGRILRTLPNKPISKIYDFIILPQDYNGKNFAPTMEDAYLVDRELRRIKEYNYASNNRTDNDVIISDIEYYYKGILEDFYDTRKRNR